MSGSNRGKKRGKIKIAKEKTKISAGNDNNHNDYEETLKDEKKLKVPFVHIEIETVGDMSNDNQPFPPREQISIEEIVKSILRSIDLLIKYDPDSLRSTNVRVKIITALFCYRDLVDNKILNFSMDKDSGELVNNYYRPSEDIETVICDYETKHDNLNETDSRDVEFATIDEESMSIKRLKDKIKDKQLMEECSSLKQLKKEPFSNVKKLIAWFKKKNIHRTKRKFRRNNIDGVKLKRRIRTSLENKLYVPETTDSFDEGDVSIKEEVPLDIEPLNSTLPRFVCDMCDVSLVSEHHLAVHKLLCRRRLFYYGNPKLEEFWNDIKCPLCDVKCNHRGNLGRHYITHRVRDIEAAFATYKDKDLNMNDPENNMKLLNDFITEFEKADKEKGILMTSSDKSSQEEETVSLENKKTTKKISDYLKFNVKKIVYDIDFDKDHYCYTCDLVFKDKEELERHKKKINDTDAFICNHCDKTFDMPIKLIHHMKTHSGLYDPKSLYLSFKEDSEGCPTQLDYKIYVCKYCLAMFVQAVSLQSHMSYYNKYRECCSKKYKSPRGTAAKRTPPGVQKTEDGKLKCDKCDKTYGNYSVFLRHSKSHAEHSKYFCECGKGFKSKERLKFHINLVHNRKFQVICEICGLNVLHHNLRRHKRVHSSLKPFKCNYCNKTFKYKGSVTTHIRIHTQEKPWQCQYCGVAFSEKRRYDIHINVHEGKTPFKCHLCPSAFVSKLKLNKHVLQHQDCRL